MKQFFIADYHFYHRNCITFDKRPFADVDEMNEYMVNAYNSKVGEDDECYILGDLCLAGPKQANSVLSRLQGRKILIRGNHEKYYDNPEFIRSLYDEVYDYKRIVISNQIVILSHFPFVDWDQKHRGAIHLYGHVHAQGLVRFPYLLGLENAYCVSANMVCYEPRTLDEITLNYPKWLEKLKEFEIH